jgi:hypothetical protein
VERLTNAMLVLPRRLHSRLLWCGLMRSQRCLFLMNIMLCVRVIHLLSSVRLSAL